MINVVDTRRRAVEVWVLRRVAEPAHPVEFADFDLPWGFELSDCHFKQYGVRTFATGLQPLIDQNGREREARRIVR